jgi:hypothetical protein
MAEKNVPENIFFDRNTTHSDRKGTKQARGKMKHFS